MKSRIRPPAAFTLALMAATLGMRLTITYATEPARSARFAALSPGESLASAGGTARAEASAPLAGVLVAAGGDIACDPADPNFARGRGRRGDCKQRAVANAILDRSPDAVLVLGDEQYDDARKGKFLRSYDRSWGRFKDISFPVPGNHEYYTPRAAGYWDYFHRRAGERGLGYYSFDVGTWHVIGLNSNCTFVKCAAGSRQYRWLRNDLASNPTTCSLAYMHHPRFSTGPHGGANFVRPLWRLLYDAGVELVLSGHDHTYERFAPQKPDGTLDRETGIRQFVSGVGGAETYWFASRDPHSQAREADALGVLFLTLGDGEYSWQFDRVSGDRFSDTGRGVCH